MTNKSGAGKILAIGGKPGTMMLRNVVGHSGGKAANIAVLTHASSNGVQVGHELEEDFSGFGAHSVRVLYAGDSSEKIERVFEDVTGIYMCGGDQSALMSNALRDGVVAHIVEAHRRGIFVAGNSAGAAALASNMIAGGMPKGNAFIKNGALEFGGGLGLIKDVIIDTHVDYYSRALRLFAEVVLAPTRPSLVIGLDEDTGILVTEGIDHNCAEVVGTSYVWLVCKGQNTKCDIKTVSESNGGLGNASVENLVCSALAAGKFFELPGRVRRTPA